MLYLFGDESYPDSTSGRTVTYLVIAVLQDNYQSKVTELRACFGTKGRRRQRELLKILSSLRASIVLGRAEIPEHLGFLEAMEAPDIGRIPVKSALWACAFGFTCSVALHSAVSSGVVFSCADFFYDTNDIRNLLEEATHEAMKRLLSQQLSQVSTLRFGPNAIRPSLRNISSVPKYPRPYSPQHIQLGVACAHELQTHALHLPEEAAANGIEFRDFSAVVAQMFATGELVTDDTPSQTL
jgi:hypothetical protein